MVLDKQKALALANQEEIGRGIKAELGAYAGEVVQTAKKWALIMQLRVKIGASGVPPSIKERPTQRHVRGNSGH